MTEQLRSLLLVALLPVFCRGDLSAAVQVDREGVSGSVNFTQEHEGSGVTVSLQLEGIGSETVQLAIHSLPFPPSSPNPCQLVGPVFRAVGTANTQGSMNYTTISLYGRESIVGRSLMITAINNSLSICANIRPPTNSTVLWAPFRSNNVTNGNVFLWKQTVYVSLVTEESSSELPWAILSPMSECVIAPVNIYNPDGVSGECGSDNVSGCVVGDLGGRNGRLSVENGAVRAVVNDPGLDISGVGGLILAVGTQCATIQTFPSLRVVGVAGEGGVVLTQYSPLDTTEVNLIGPHGLILEIHTLPPRTECSSTEGIFDPRGAGFPSQGSTLDMYPFGDLTGKAGGRVVYFDPFLPLTGDDSVVGRSLVVKRTNGSISGCGLLQYDDDIIEIRADLEMEGFSGIVVFSQRASDPFSQTIITVETNISADIEVFTPTPMSTSLEATPTTTPLIATTFTPSPTPSSLSPSLLLPYETSSVVLATSPFPLLSSSPVLLLIPDTTDTSTPVSTVAPGQQRRRRETGVYNWSLRQWSGGVSGDAEDCAQLPIIGSSSEGCSRSSPLSCASGDLSTKHGPLSPGPMSAIFHDPFLPLSGPQSVGSAILFLEPANGVGESACVLVTMVTSATPTPTPSMSSSVELRTSSQSSSSVTTSTPLSSSVVATTIPPTRQQTGDDVNIVLIGAIVGGVVAAALVLTVLVLCLYLCIRRLRSGRVDLNKQDMKNGRDVELGHYQQKPQIGSDHYRAVSSYHPQTADSGDLVLEEGEWVTLLEAPPGGQWWRGQTAAGEGWFPKSHVQLVDREAERRKAEEENFKLAAAAIRAASNSFNERHHSLATKNKATPTSSRRARAPTTFSKADINCTPVLTAKFSTSVLDSVVIENQRHLSASTASGGSRPHTPRSLPESEPLANLTNHISAENSQGSSGSSELANMNLESYLVRYNYGGGTDIELPLRKGDVVSVLEKREGGWWQGVCGGRVGWFPASYIKPAPAREVTEEEKETGGEEKREEEGEGLPGMEESLQSDTVEATEYKAIHTFTSGQEGDLQFSEGDTVLVYWVQESGWWYGSCGGTHHGWFPWTYVELSVSEAGSPLPPSTETESATGEGEEMGKEEEKAVVRDSPARRSWRKKLSFKRSKSQEGTGEGGLAPLLPAPEVKGERKKSPSRPRRTAPPPPANASSKPGDQSQTMPPASKSTIPSSKTTPTTNEATPTTTENSAQTQHVAMQHKRRKTSSALDPNKPRRLPPSPPTSLATPQTPPTKSAHPPTSAEAAPAAMAPPSGGATPIALPRRKKKRVQRPATRLIPPPPTIPLPLPPTRPSQNSPKAPQSSAARPVQLAAVPQREAEGIKTLMMENVLEGTAGSGSGTSEAGKEKQRFQPEATTTEVVEKERGTALKSPVKTKPPPIKPKPEHLSKRVSNSQVASAVSQPAGQGSPRPPPPARTSSLHHPIPPRRREPKTSLAAIPDPTTPTEEVDHNRRESPGNQETAEAVRNLRSAPPSHPPPPRPPSAGAEGPKPRSQPPSFPPPDRPTSDAESATAGSPARSNSLRARGSQLMRSLRKIVQRSESMKEEGVETETSSPTKNHPRSKQGEVIQNLVAESPDMGRKTEYEGQNMEKQPVIGSGLPARPPLPRLVKKTSEDGGKQTPVRPPPPKLTSNKTEATPSSPVHTEATPTSPVKTMKNRPASPDNTQNHTPSPLPGSSGPSPIHSAGSGPGSRSVSPQPPSSFYRVLADYTAKTPSELTLHAGDVLVELDRPTTHMFYGMLDDGSTGLFPASAVEPMSIPSSSRRN